MTSNYDKAPPPRRLKLLLMAERGMGKTTQLAHLANAGFRVAVMDIDNKLQVVRSHLRPEAAGNIRYNTLPPIVGATWERAAKLLVEPWDDWGAMSTWGPDTVLAVDTASFLSTCCLEFSKSKMGAVDKNVKFDQAVWMEHAARFERYTGMLTSDANKFNVIFMCHTTSFEPDVGARRVVPMFEGQRLLDRIPKAFTDIWWLVRLGNGNNVVRTLTTSEAILNNSNPLVIGKEEPADLGALFKKVLA